MNKENSENNTKLNITYHFATNTKTEITVDILVKQENLTPEEAIKFCNLVKDMDEEDKRIERKETRRHVSLETFNDDIHAPQVSTPDMSIEEQILLGERMDKLFKAINTELTPKQRIRLLRRIYGMSLEEIAKLENVHFTAVSQSINYAVEKIKKIFSDTL